MQILNAPLRQLWNSIPIESNMIMTFFFQLRLDFDTFTITGPSTLTTSTVKTIGGSVATDGAESSGASQCATDLFSVTNLGGSNTPPSICGTNTGEHSMTYFFKYMEPHFFQIPKFSDRSLNYDFQI